LFVGSANGSSTFSGSIVGGGTTQGTIGVTQSAIHLNKVGLGTLTLSGNANTYQGNTTVTAGALQLGANNATSPHSVHAVNAGATLDLSNFSASVGNLSGAGTVTTGAGAGGTLSVGSLAFSAATGATSDSAANASTFSGSVTGNGGLNKYGLGTLVLS